MQDFPRTCWRIMMYHNVPVEDRYPQLRLFQSSLSKCFFKKQDSSSTPFTTCGVSIKPVAIIMALILFPSFHFCSRCKERRLRSPRSIPYFQHFHVCQDVWSACGPSIWTSAADLWPGPICQTPQSQPQRSQSGKLQPSKIVHGWYPKS